MKYMLDTNVCIGIINGKEPTLREKIKLLSTDDVFICSIVKAELLYGAKKSQQRLKNEERLKIFFSEIRCVPFDDESADHYGNIRALLEQSGKVIGANDLLIAAIALHRKFTLVTRNYNEFSRIPSLKIEAW